MALEGNRQIIRIRIPILLLCLLGSILNIRLLWGKRRREEQKGKETSFFPFFLFFPFLVYPAPNLHSTLKTP